MMCDAIYERGIDMSLQARIKESGEEVTAVEYKQLRKKWHNFISERILVQFNAMCLGVATVEQIECARVATDADKLSDCLASPAE